MTSDEKVFELKGKFKLSDSFLSEFEGKQPEFGPLGYVTYKRTYARKLDDGTSEEFLDTVKRIVEGTYSIQKTHCKNLKLPWDNAKSQRSAQEMFRRIWSFKFLPPGRGLWMMGTPFVERAGAAALNNCGFASTKDIKTDFAAPFVWLMEMSMLGVGVGFDTKGAGTVKIVEPKINKSEHFVEDTREAWCEIIAIILNAYVGKGSIPQEINFSNIRAKGLPINGFGGVASGPDPLIELITSVRAELDNNIGEFVSTELIVDISNLIGRCVVAGNVRRSAQIAFGEPNDQDFFELKNPEVNQDKLYHHRWASNNSIFADVGMDYSKACELITKNGEPGFMWLENAKQYSRMGRDPDFSDMRASGGNPCLEQTLETFELCCLVETFPSRHDSLDDWKETLKYAYLYAKTVTLVPTHDARTNNVLLRNRRIGTSISGIVQAMSKFGRRNFLNACDSGYAYLRRLDEIYSEWLCVPKSRKITSIKPSGSISLLPGVTPGIHFPHSKFYLRRIRFQSGSQLPELLQKQGYHVEPDLYSPDTVVASFPIKEDFFDRSKSEVTMWEQLELAAQIQEHWADNQVSVTVTFKSEEASQLKYALELYETRLKGVSFLPIIEHGYKQAPYEEITEEQYMDMSSKIKGTIAGVQENVHDKDEKFCDGDVCLIG